MADWFLYVIETDGGRLYTGISTDVERRLAEHQAGKKGARFLRGRKHIVLKHQQPFINRSLASKAEYAFKQLRREEKLYWLAQGSIPFNPATGKIEPAVANTENSGLTVQQD
ncbi:putative endonuclease [Oceanospirillum multiglobuliferum]|uniref:GIY-YIG domain-containing protein n=1 Tax=Oceanospirillum multiglobuliferum TaxID=64969 RepID=A0A1T4S034_9GAMM|nr:GIY-YIG nuclease family protein [Oceanospirillum multiglobuliferum]OPX54542.1 hypothetical protein BTE48_13715 [Oceanospirillum multiglobuliferum]SKA21542.1 putative endonuclease [Oceanospirillum multiglobuliferum]